MCNTMPMTVSKTRDMLVDVARQLFARMGVDNTTMNDIAQASKKGRRTLYTYFKSKNEIYLIPFCPAGQTFEDTPHIVFDPSFDRFPS